MIATCHGVGGTLGTVITIVIPSPISATCHCFATARVIRIFSGRSNGATKAIAARTATGHIGARGVGRTSDSVTSGVRTGGRVARFVADDRAVADAFDREPDDLLVEVALSEEVETAAVLDEDGRPVGLLAYMLVRFSRGQGISLFETGQDER